MENTPSKPLLSIENLHTSFYLDEGEVCAVRGIDLDVFPVETLGVVGESGCGKSIMAMSVLNMIFPPGKIVEGRILFRQGEQVIDLASFDPNSKQIREVRGRDISIIFQEPMTSLSPVHTVGSQITEAITLHQKLKGSQARERAIEMMAKVSIPAPRSRFNQYPHELSGGMRQRIMIAMALSCGPKLLIADEPTTALDVTTQSQILQLIKKMQYDENMAVMLITHDLGVIAENADKVAVIYLGKVVEYSNVNDIFNEPLHPYTQLLMKSMPSIRGKHRAKLEAIEGSVPSPFANIEGCSFHPRCPFAKKGICDRQFPPMLKEVKQGHKVACFLAKGYDNE